MLFKKSTQALMYIEARLCEEGNWYTIAQQPQHTKTLHNVDSATAYMSVSYLHKELILRVKVRTSHNTHDQKTTTKDEPNPVQSYM